MNKELNRTKKTKTKSKAEIQDLKAKKDPKGGIIAILIGMGAKKQSSTLH